MTEKRFTVDSDGKWWDRIKHEYVTLDSLFRTVEELDKKLESKQYTINEMAKTIRIYDDGYIDLNKKYKKLAEDNKMLNRMIDKRDGWNNLAHEQLFKLGKENEQLKNAIIGKIQYGEDLEKFAIEKGLIQEDWARFDDYD